MRRLLISGLSGGSGKTIVSLGLTRFYSRQNHVVYPFKKGPDYIDSAWLKQAGSRPCYCLDPFFLEQNALYSHFYHCLENAPKNAIAIIEGNRGIFDGKDVHGSCSTAQLSHILDVPVLLTINCTKMTRTTAALVMGIQHFDPKLKLAGVILNNIASSRHGSIIQKSIEEYTDIPVLGIIPRQKENPIPERHMGLSLKDFHDKDSILDNLANIICENTNTTAILERMEISALAKPEERAFGHNTPQEPINIAYLYDDAFWFYYQENFEALQKEGATCIPLSLLAEESLEEQLEKFNLTLKDIHGFYFGGGYPELFAKELSTSPKLDTLRQCIENNMPVYAECGGFMLCSKAIHCIEDNAYIRYPMLGIFDIETKFQEKPQGLGYTEATTIKNNPYHSLNSTWKGHEFHFSTAINYQENQEFLLELSKGHGMVKKDKGLDGILYKNCYASYTHLFAPATPNWAKNFTNVARQYKNQTKK